MTGWRRCARHWRTSSHRALGRTLRDRRCARTRRRRIDQQRPQTRAAARGCGRKGSLSDSQRPHPLGGRCETDHPHASVELLAFQGRNSTLACPPSVNAPPALAYAPPPDARTRPSPKRWSRLPVWRRPPVAGTPAPAGPDRGRKRSGSVDVNRESVRTGRRPPRSGPLDIHETRS